MNKQDITNAIKVVRENSKKRKFAQTFDLVINLKGLDLKKPEENLNLFFALPHGKGKKNKIAVLVGNEAKSKVEGVCDTVILKGEFDRIDKKKVERLANENDFFIAQADLMPLVAKSFGKILGPKGKMPNPKAGCLFPPGADIKPLVDRLNKTVRLQTKNELIVKAPVGTEAMKDEEIIENISALYNHLIHSLPQEKNNIGSVLLKLTMGKPIKFGDKISEDKADKQIVLDEENKVKKEAKRKKIEDVQD